MKHLITFFLLITIFGGCGIIKTVPVQSITEVHYVDSLRVRDSVVIIPAEKEADIALPTDTLHLETSLATADAWLDTATNTLKGILQNKTGIAKEYVFQDRVEYRDSIQRVEIPVEVVKEKNKHYDYEKYLWIYVVLSLLATGLYLYMKKTK